MDRGGDRGEGRAAAGDRLTVPLRVGLLGFGAIGRAVSDLIASGQAGDTRLVAILVRDPARARAVAPARVPVVGSRGELLAAGPNVVVEAAGHAALVEHAEAILAAGVDLVAVSVGAFADDAFLERIRAVASKCGRRVVVPSGAIAALDGIGSASLESVDEVVHTVRKPPRAFTPEQLGGPAPTNEPRLLYSGPARAGVLRFPENVNVAAAVSLAGVGLDRTQLRIYADPSLDRNVHEVHLRGRAAEIDLVIRNVPSENPKTGRIVALSVARTLRDMTAAVIIGG